MNQYTERDRTRLSDQLRLLWELWRDRPLKPGKMVAGQYEVVHALGSGSYGISYLVQDREFGRRCVLKQVKPSKRRGSKGRPIFDYETSILATLDHPCIPKLLHRFEWRGGLFFAMEYMAGPNLEDVIFAEGARFGEREALERMRELLSIVEYVHAHGIVHRDVRIPNVILMDGRLRLIDFGLARRLGDPATQDAEVLDDYAMEKQLKRAVAFTSDFYAMGHFLLFLLYSTYEEDSEVERSWEEELAHLTPQTKSLLRRMLQLDTSFESADELRVALEEAKSAAEKNQGR
jgi:serine/threonine protein kinase, bacterial